MIFSGSTSLGTAFTIWMDGWTCRSRLQTGISTTQLNYEYLFSHLSLR
jgi:hypothetical protein